MRVAGGMGCRDAIAPSGGIYRPRNPRPSPLYQCVARHAEEMRVGADDRERRMKLADYMLRAPLSLAKMSYDAASHSAHCEFV